MNYIVSKLKLSKWIEEVVSKTYNGDIKEAVFAEVF